MLVTGKPVPRPQYQFTNNESRVFKEQEIKLTIYQVKMRTGIVNVSKLCCPPAF
jgi:hypothetical protein